MINKERPTTETRQRLVDAARDLFWKQGYASTGIAEILKAADAGSGSLYHFFPTKEDLLVAVLQWYVESLGIMVVDPVFHRVADPIERIFGILDGYRQMLTMTDFQHGCPIGNLSIEVANSHPGPRQLVELNFTNWSKVIEGCLVSAAGKLPEVDVARIARFVLVTMEGAVMLARTYRSIQPYDDAVTVLRDYFDRLIADGTNWVTPRTQPLTRIDSNPMPSPQKTRRVSSVKRKGSKRGD